MIHLGIQRALGQRLLQRIQQAALSQRRTGITSSQQLVQQLVPYRRFFASGHIGFPSFPLCPHTHDIPDSSNEHLFPSLAARRIIEAWRTDYNTVRPHSSPGGMALAEFTSCPCHGHEDTKANLSAA